MAYTTQESITAIKPTYIVVYIGLQLANIIFLTYLDMSPLVFTYAVALMAMRYTMTKLTTKYQQEASIGFNSEFMIIVALTNGAVTLMMHGASGFDLSIANLIGIFVFLMLFSNIGVFLEKWYEFIRSKRGGNR